MNPIPINPIQSNEAERIRVDEMAARRNAEKAGYSLHGNISLIVALKPTCELRLLDRWADIGGGIMRGGHPVLQQCWACALTGKSEWRDVPVVME